MVRPERVNWIDEAIAATAPGQAPQPDFAAWRRAHPEALHVLAQRAQRTTKSPTGLTVAIAWGRQIMRSPITKLAAAAALIAGIFILTTHLTGRETPTPQPGPTVVEYDPVPTPQEDGVEDELVQAETLYVQGNTEGLLILLQTGRTETQRKVAEYLGQIGDHTALPTLQSLAAQWQGAPGANPFEAAIEKIGGRQQPTVESDPNVPEPNSQSAPDIQNASASSTAMPRRRASEQESTDALLIAYAGIVTDEAGLPVAGVRVWGQKMSLTLECTALSTETSTNAEGRFRLTAKRPITEQEIYRILHFDHPEYGMGWLMRSGVNEQNENIQIVLQAPASVAGIVTDSLGQPIADALVEANVRVVVDGHTNYLLLWDLTGLAEHTDHDGRFVLNRLPASSALQMRVSAGGYAQYTGDHTWRGKTYSVEAGDQDIQIAMEQGGSIAGRILHRDGSPYAQRALITIEGPIPERLIFPTEDDGRFVSVGLPPGLYSVYALREPSKQLCQPVEVPVEVDQEMSEITLTTMAEGLPLSVQVVDENTGEPLAGISVRAEFQDTGEGSVDYGKTDEAGQCVLSVPPGRHHIVAQGWKNGKLVEFDAEILLEPDHTHAAVVVAITARPRVAGQLVDVQGHAIEGFVQIGSGDRCQTDPDGRFVTEEPFSDAFKHQPSWAYDTSRQMGKMFLFRRADYTDELLIVLEPCATLSGRIVNSAGLAQLDVEPKVGICCPGGSTRYYTQVPWKTTVDENGIFIVDDVPIGLPIHVSAERKGLQGEIQVDDVLPGEIRTVGDIQLRGYGGIDETTDWTGTLEGTITDETNKPVRRVTVQAYTGTDHFEAVTNRRGRYKLTGLPKDIKLNFSLYLPEYGHCHKYVYADSDDGDMQIFPHGWDLLGKEAPPLSIARWFNSPPVTLEALRGKVVLLQIGVLLPLYGEHLTTMQKMHQKYAGQGLELIAVHQPLDVTWGGKVAEEDLEMFAGQSNVPFVFCLDKQRETYRAYGPKAVPALYLIDRDGRVVVSPAKDNVEEWVKHMLAK